ncbi:MAG: FAD-binding oxidoreductase [Desulfobacterales bacterium]|nr:FAD-binding oxidoreductase [Desulfobacterales bacterium]
MKLLSKDMYKKLEKVLGEENISQEPVVLDGYAWQPIFNLKSQKWTPRPAAVVLPETTEEVQQIVKLCNKYKVKFKAHSTGWASWGSPSEEGELQIDLRRMNRIIELDEKNKYALVEPYTCCAQLQAEAMKKGLTCHIIGAGPNTSALASATSGWGYGGTGLATGYSGRNLLGVEWVLPDGEVLTLGSPGSDAGWFSGDGPGPSLRGIMRGFAGTQGSLGVFTKCAVKLFPYYGPKEPKIEGVLLDIKTEVPETEKMFYVMAPSYEKYADITYKIGDAEIAHWIQRGPMAAFVEVFMPNIPKEVIYKSPQMRSILKAFKHMGAVALSSESKREVAYQEKVLRKIALETGCIVVDVTKLPGFGFWWFMGLRSIPTALTFRSGGDFLTSYGSPVEYDNAMRQAKVATEYKQKYIDKGCFFDDTSDLGWGGIYEGTANWGHCEMPAMFVRSDGKAHQRTEYLEDSAKSTVDQTLGLGLSNLPPGAWKIYGPMLNNYHLWQARIKKAFDPNKIGDEEFYVPSIDDIEE